MSENSNIISDEELDKWLLKNNRHMVHQRLLDNCEDFLVSAADLKEDQKLLKTNIRPPADEDWEQIRKCFSNLPTSIIYHTFKHTTKYGVLPPLSHQ